MTDFLYDNNFDLLIKDGDLVIGDVTSQAAQEVLLADKGWYAFDPNVGAGLMVHLNDDVGSLNSLIDIRKGLEADGMTVRVVDLIGETLQLDFEYNKRVYRSNIKAFYLTGVRKIVVPNERQSVFDLGLIYYGQIDGAFRIAELLEIEEFPPIFSKNMIYVDVLQNYTGDLYDKVSVELATLLDSENRGIGHWTIGQDFKIS